MGGGTSLGGMEGHQDSAGAPQEGSSPGRMEGHGDSAGAPWEGWMERHPQEGTLPGGMEGHGSSAGTHPTRFLTAQILILATEEPKNAVFLHVMQLPPPTRSHPLPSACVRAHLRCRWPFYRLYMLTCSHVGETEMSVK